MSKSGYYRSARNSIDDFFAKSKIGKDCPEETRLMLQKARKYISSLRPEEAEALRKEVLEELGRIPEVDDKEVYEQRISAIERIIRKYI